MVGNPAGKRELFIHLIAAKAGKIVPTRIKEKHIDLAGSRLNRRRLTRAQLAVNLQQAFLTVLCRILFKCGKYPLVITEIIQDIFICGKAKGAAKHRNRQLAVFIYTDIEYIRRIRLIFKPSAAVGVHGSAEQIVADLILGCAVEYAWGANQLTNDNTFCTVYDEGTCIGHKREISHEDLLVLDLAGFLIQQTSCNAQRGSIGNVPLLTFLNGVLGLAVQAIIHKAQRQITGVILNSADIVENLSQAFVQKPLVRIFLNLDQVRHLDDFVDVGKAHPLGFAEFYGLDFHHKINHSLLLYSTDGCCKRYA